MSSDSAMARGICTPAPSVAHTSQSPAKAFADRTPRDHAIRYAQRAPECTPLFKSEIVFRSTALHRSHRVRVTNARNGVTWTVVSLVKSKNV